MNLEQTKCKTKVIQILLGEKTLNGYTNSAEYTSPLYFTSTSHFLHSVISPLHNVSTTVVTENASKSKLQQLQKENVFPISD